MNKIRERKHGICRRVGYCLYNSPKCPSVKRAYSPGQQGKSRGRKLTDYGKQLLEKQKLKYTYGMREKQFRRFFKIASSKKGATGENLLVLLESRLDNIVYRLKFATNIFDARQMVSHKHILIDKKRTNIPSCIVQPNSKISLTAEAKKFSRVQIAMESEEKEVPAYLKKEDNFSGVFLGIKEISEIPTKIELSHIVELYSK
ncbi:MAG: 30S ribosomal protein S4 [Candidatus Omnitrophica bacterium]|nr:30S ribosomal protein S4 [Candidatus Omnitrophota bacterium]